MNQRYRSSFRFRSKLATAAAVAIAVLEFNAAANDTVVVPVPAIPEVAPSALYKVKVNGQEIPVNDESRFDFHTAAFCMSGTATVEIMFARDVKDCVVQPSRHGIVPSINGRSVAFSISQPLKLVVRINRGEPGLPLALLATPLETGVPKPADPNVVYFGPGVHEAGVIEPVSGQTIYLAPGALVKGRIKATKVSNVMIKGRGILDSSACSIRKEKTVGILFDHCSNITVEGIGHRSGSWWQSLYLASDHIQVSHMNLFGKTVNTDGVDIDGVKNFTVRDCFIRCEDDGFGWHAVDAKANGELTTENVLGENCVIWNTGYGNGLRIGASMESPLFQNITLRNLDILAHANAAICSDHSDWAWCRNIRFENVAAESPGTLVQIAIAKTKYSNDNGYKNERGHYDGLHFVHTTAPAGKIILHGCDQDHRIDNVSFEDCYVGGKLIDSLRQIDTNAFVTNVTFKNSGSR